MCNSCSICTQQKGKVRKTVCVCVHLLKMQPTKVACQNRATVKAFSKNSARQAAASISQFFFLIESLMRHTAQPSLLISRINKCAHHGRKWTEWAANDAEESEKKRETVWLMAAKRFNNTRLLSLGLMKMLATKLWIILISARWLELCALNRGNGAFFLAMIRMEILAANWKQYSINHPTQNYS